jgi:hypothetical protein
VHLQTSLVQSFALLFQNFEKVVQIIALKRFGGAPHYNQLAPLGFSLWCVQKSSTKWVFHGKPTRNFITLDTTLPNHHNHHLGATFNHWSAKADGHRVGRPSLGRPTLGTTSSYLNYFTTSTACLEGIINTRTIRRAMRVLSEQQSEIETTIRDWWQVNIRATLLVTIQMMNA